MPACPVTMAYLTQFVVMHRDNLNALVEAQVEQATELQELAAQSDVSRRAEQLRSFLLLEAIITRPRTVLDPIASTTWERSRKGLNHVLRVCSEKRLEITALEAEHVLGAGFGRSSTSTSEFEVKLQSRVDRLLELTEGCATLLRRSLLNTGTKLELHHIGRWGMMAIMLNNTASEAMGLARELLAQTAESNRRAWETQTP